ncbi:MAG: acyl CoA:acetate/3-ketoacid CoA transferase [Aestuariivirga sp.]
MQIMTAAEAAALVEDGDTILVGGSGNGHSVPEKIMAAVEERFLAESRPRNITSIHPVGLGDRATKGASHFAHAGLLKRIVCGTYVDSPPIADMAARNEIEAYTLPQGAISLLIREIAGGRPGLITHTGLHTFVDPRQAGGRQSAKATEDLIEVVTLAGREWLFYKPFAIDVALLRGTTSDEDGNITMEHEAIYGEMLSMAQAARRCGGLVIAQVKRLARRETLAPKAVKIPGMFVDVVVVDPDQWQTYRTKHDPAYAGELRVPLAGMPELPFDERKIVARRAALELYPGAICNIGSGISTGLPAVAAEEDVLDRIVLTNEQGLIGGAPSSDAGAARNYTAIVDQPYQFDFYDGGGIDLAFLSAAEVDAEGNVNVSRFADKIIGIGGFVNISQNARNVIFSGTFTAGGLKVVASGGRLRILQEGKHRKFVKHVEQICFNGKAGASRGQQVIYVTERAVFRLDTAGPELMEIAPGLDLAADIIAHMDFPPKVSPALKTMDARLFDPRPMGLASSLAGASRRHPRLTQRGS